MLITLLIQLLVWIDRWPGKCRQRWELWRAAPAASTKSANSRYPRWAISFIWHPSAPIQSKRIQANPIVDPGRGLCARPGKLNRNWIHQERLVTSIAPMTSTLTLPWHHPPDPLSLSLRVTAFSGRFSFIWRHGRVHHNRYVIKLAADSIGSHVYDDTHWKYSSEWISPFPPFPPTSEWYLKSQTKRLNERQLRRHCYASQATFSRNCWSCRRILLPLESPEILPHISFVSFNTQTRRGKGACPE